MRRPIPWIRSTRLPQWPFELERDNPLTRNLVCCVVFGGGGAVDIAAIHRLPATPGNLTAQLLGVGVDSYTITVPSGDTALDFTSGAWSIACWGTLTGAISFNGGIDFIKKATYVSEANNQGWTVSAQNDANGNRFHFASLNNNGNANYLLKSTTVPSAGTWHIVGTSDAATIRRLYINGSQENTTSLNVTPAAASSNVQYTASGAGSSGSLIVGMAWSRELSAADVALLFNPDTRWDIFRRPRRVFTVFKPVSATFTAVLTASVSPAGAIVNKPEPGLSASVSPAGAIGIHLTGHLSAGVNPAGATKSTPSTSLSASVTPSAALKRTLGTKLAAGVSPAGSILRRAISSLSGAVGPTAGLTSRVTNKLAALVSSLGRISAGVGEAPCNLPLADLINRTWQLLDDDGTYFTHDEVRSALNKAQRLFAFLTLCLEKTVTFNLTNGQYFYQVSSQIADFLCFLRVSWVNPNTGAKVRLLADTLHQMDALDDTWRNRPGNPVRYAQEGFDTFWITPQPASGVNALKGTYAREPVAMVSDADVPEIAPDQQIYLPYGGYFILHLKIGGQELQNAVQYLKVFLDAAKKYQASVRSRSRGQLYDVKPFDLASFDMGRFDLKLSKAKSKGPTQSQLKQEQRNVA